MLLIICFQITNSQWRSVKGARVCERMRVRGAYACNQFCHRNTYLYTHERPRAREIYAPRTKHARREYNADNHNHPSHRASHPHSCIHTHKQCVNPCYMLADEWIARRIVLLDSFYHINSTSTFRHKVFAPLNFAWCCATMLGFLLRMLFRSILSICLFVRHLFIHPVQALK